jgi:hypothetical protein
MRDALQVLSSLTPEDPAGPARLFCTDLYLGTYIYNKSMFYPLLPQSSFLGLDS